MRPIRWLRRGMVLVSLGAAGGALIVTARHMLETPQPLQSVLPGEGRIDRKHGGDIYYNVAGDESADPIVLLHDFYLGASNYEYRHLFPRLAPTWRVYAPDWLGFGMSEHPPLAYTGEFYANMLLGFLRDVVKRPAVVVAHGLAANIAARAAADVPELFSRLVLVSPNVEAGIDLDPKPTQVLARAAQRTSLGLVPYAFLSTKPLLRRLAHRRSALTGDDVAREESVEHLYASAHQFGGQHALLALMTGELDLPIQNIFPLLQPPVLLVSGDEDPARPVGVMEDLAVLNPHADLDVLTSAGESAFEDQPAMFTEALLDWLATAMAPQQPQVEEQHPMPQADATPIGADEPATREPAAEEPALPETRGPLLRILEIKPQVPPICLILSPRPIRPRKYLAHLLRRPTSQPDGRRVHQQPGQPVARPANRVLRAPGHRNRRPDSRAKRIAAPAARDGRREEAA